MDELERARQALQDRFDRLSSEAGEITKRLEQIGPELERVHAAMLAIDAVTGRSEDPADPDKAGTPSMFSGSGTLSLAPLDTLTAVERVFAQAKENDVYDAQRVHKELVQMGWRSSSRTPVNVVQTALSALSRDGKIDRVKRGFYRREPLAFSSQG